MCASNRFATLFAALIGTLAVQPALATDGYFDTTWAWAPAGHFEFSIPNANGDGGRVILEDADENLLIAGVGDHWWLGKLGSSGQFVASFGPNGTGLTTNCDLGVACAGADAFQLVTAIAQRDGKYLVLQSDHKLVRTTAQAKGLDTTGTFNGTGIVDIDALKLSDANGYLSSVTAIAQDYEGHILVAGPGRASASATTDGFALIRLNDDLSLDTAFGAHTDNGVTFAGGNAFMIDAADVVERVDAVIPLADGFILLVGIGSHNADGSQAWLELARVNRLTGLLATDWNGGGINKVWWPAGELNASNTVAAGADGLLNVTIATTTAPPNGFLVGRIKPNGQADTSWGTNGFTATQYCQENIARALTFDSAGRILVVGSCLLAQDGHWYFEVERVRGSDGVLDTTFGISGFSRGWFNLYDISDRDDGFGIAFDVTGHPVVIGYTQLVNTLGYDQGVARLTYDLSYLNNFESAPSGCLPPDCN